MALPEMWGHSAANIACDFHNARIACLLVLAHAGFASGGTLLLVTGQAHARFATDLDSCVLRIDSDRVAGRHSAQWSLLAQWCS